MIYRIVWADGREESLPDKHALLQRMKELHNVRRFGNLNEMANCVPSDKTNDAVWVGLRPIYFSGGYNIDGVVLEIGENFVHRKESYEG